MLPSSLLVAVGATLILVGSVQGQRGKCPFNAQAQMSVYTSMQRQTAMNQFAVSNQMRYLSVQRNAMPVRMPSLPMRLPSMPVRMNTSLTNFRSTPVRLNNQRLLTPRTFSALRPTIRTTPMRLTGTLHRCGPARPSVASAVRATAQRKTLVSRQNTPATAVRKTANVARMVGISRQNTAVTPARLAGVPRQNTFITQQRKTHNERRREMVARHTPNVQVRINLSMTCGSCHNCPQGRTVLAPPPRLPSLDIARLRPASAPVVRNPAPRLTPIIARPFPNLPQVLPGPLPQRPLPVLVAQRPGLPLTLPVQRPPTLPPLAVTRDRPLTTLPTQAPESETSIAPSALGKPAPGSLGMAPPPLKGLEGTVIQINPLLGTDKMLVREPATLSDAPRLAPETVYYAPALPPLRATRHLERGLLPTLDAEDRSELDALDAGDRPARLQLVLEPPPLPSLTR